MKINCIFYTLLIYYRNKPVCIARFSASDVKHRITVLHNYIPAGAVGCFAWSASAENHQKIKIIPAVSFCDRYKGLPSSSSSSTQPHAASVAIRIASASESPSLTQPGRSGTSTVEPPFFSSHSDLTGLCRMYIREVRTSHAFLNRLSDQRQGGLFIF